MDRLSERLDQLSPLQRAVFALKETRAKLEAVERAQAEPIAIVGMACRFPGGADSPRAFWKLLCDGVDAIREVPADRWDVDAYYDPDPLVPGKTNSRWGGFLDGIDGFDKQFFGISQREAVRIDPQQRLMLELAWEALEDAGLPAARLQGSKTGVFIGISGSEYFLLQAGDPLMADAFAGTGTAPCIAANRLSFVFDLRGPSVAVDTACSSSLVAVHEACQSLRSGESRLALAGGVNIILWPNTSVSLTKAAMSSPDGRCRAFDANANGYVRGEGGGIVVLKPLSAALADGDPIHAVIRGSAVNQDGQSNGIKSPNRQAQEAVLREAYARAGVSPGSVQYVEAHGTGTVMGDTIEARALANVVSESRDPGVPCVLGSVKSNIGHLESAAGIAGLIKVVLALKHRTVPASLHFETPNPHIPFEELGLRVQRSPSPWPEATGPAVAGVSSFGFGGTNAHVVLGEAPTAPPAEGPAARGTKGPAILPLSARSPGALNELAGAYRDLLRSNDAPSLEDVARTSGVRRNHLEHRLALLASTREEAAARLDRFCREGSGPGLWHGRKPYDRRPRAMFLFTDDLDGWRLAARSLREDEPEFRAALDECDETILRLTGWSVASRLVADPADWTRDDPARATPTLFALQVALAALWRSWGISPSGAIGFGAGEVSAACVAGALTVDDAAAIAVHLGARRSNLSSSPPLAAIRPRVATIPLISHDGRDLDGRALDVPFWAGRRAASPVSAVVRQAIGERPADVLLAIGPGPVSEGLAGPSADGGSPCPVLASIAAGATGRGSLLEALGHLYAAGFDVEWGRLSTSGAGVVALPTYPWQRERCWIDADPSRIAPDLSWNGALLDAPAGHPGDRRPTLAGSQASVQDWLYELVWQPKERSGGRPPAPTGARRWLILADTGGVGERLAGLLAAEGRECTTVTPDPSADPAWTIARALGPDPATWEGIVHLWSLEAPTTEGLSASTLAQAQALGCGSLPALVRALGRSGGGRSPRLWIVTRGVHALGQAASATTVAQAPIWGMGRTLASEHGQRWGGLIDLDPDAPIDRVVADLQAEIADPDGEDQVALRAGGRRVARLVRRSDPGVPSTPARFRPDGAYLLTGGFGGLGGVIARWMVGQGARRLILLGRTPLPPRAAWGGVDPGSEAGGRIARVRELEALGASVHIASVDVADEGAVAAWLEAYRSESWPPIRGVVHLAGTYELGSLADIEPDRLGTVMRPKLPGGWVLHRAFADGSLDFFVLFSSAASILNSPLLGGYAAANAFLDALVAYRRSLGLPALGINWGAWTDSSPTTAPASDGEAAVRRAVKAFTEEQALAILGRLIGERQGQLVAIPYAAEDWVEHPPIPPDSPVLRALRLGGPAVRAVQPRPDLSTPYEAPRTELERWMASHWEEVLKLDRVGIHDDFFELGGDSLQAAVLFNRLQSEFREMLHLLMLFDTRSIAGLAAYLRRSYPADIGRLFPGEVIDDPDGGGGRSGAPEYIDRPDVEALREMHASKVLERRLHEGPVGPRNRRAVFILAPPRSGTTLLRVMLAGHPALFAPPEMHLLDYHRLGDWKRDFPGAVSSHEGRVRALMGAKGWDAESALAAMIRYEGQGMTCQEFYGLLQASVGGRLIVDKTPTYSSHLEILTRAEAMFEEPLYIHLLRHPCGMIRSFEEYRLADSWSGRLGRPYTSRQVGEMVWVQDNENVLRFLEGVPRERQFRLRFEELVGQPDRVLGEMCEFLGLDYDPAMASPYEESGRRMIDGSRPESRMMGDVKFATKHRALEPSVADRWKEEMTGDFLGPPARDLASLLGYTDIASPYYVVAAEGGNGHPRPDGPIERIARDEESEEALRRLDLLSDDEVETILRAELRDVEAAHE